MQKSLIESHWPFGDMYVSMNQSRGVKCFDWPAIGHVPSSPLLVVESTGLRKKGGVVLKETWGSVMEEEGQMQQKQQMSSVIMVLDIFSNTAFCILLRNRISLCNFVSENENFFLLN